MIVFVNKKKITIAKARKPRIPWRKTRTYSRLSKLTDAMHGAVKADFKKGIAKFKTRVSPQKVYDAWLSKDYLKLYELVPFEFLPEDLAQYGQSIGDVLSANGNKTISLLPGPLKSNLRWDINNPRIRDYVGKRTGLLVQDITENTRQFIAQTISRSFSEALTPGKVAKMIRPAIGLGTRLSTAHANYVEGLRAQGVKESKVDVLSEKYEDRLLDYRASMIARTESAYARNAGQISVWRSAADQGLIDRHTTKKQWIVDGKPCEECLDIEDQGPIGLEEFWDSDDGALDYPPAHPNCMCGMEIVYDEDDIDSDWMDKDEEDNE